MNPLLYRVLHPFKTTHACPVCGWVGPFQDLHADTGARRHARCVGCGALERHRLQHLVVDRWLQGRDPATLSMLHFAPEAFFARRFKALFGRHETADIAMPDVDHRVDLQRLPFDDASFDVVFASHVLEHVPDDAAAIRQIHRILKPGGTAFLPVPIVVQSTIEYPAPNPNEAMHVRAPGPDYFERYRRVFREVAVYSSDDFDPRYQLHIWEDRTLFPRPGFEHRTAVTGSRHADFVPVCEK
jgi:SAM-dependent methyltransferase